MRALSTISTGLALGLVLVASGCAHKSSSKGMKESDGLATGWKDGEDDANPCAARVHFDLDSSEIPERDRPALASSAVCFKGDPSMKATIEGNADERGTEEYNLALGDKRANTVAKYLKALGAESQQIKTVSYGEEKPVCSEHDEACWFKNRRAAVRPHDANSVGASPLKKD